MGTGTLFLERFRVTAERGRAGAAEVYDAVDEQSGKPARLVVVNNVAAGEDPERVLERVSRYALGCAGIARSLAAGITGAAAAGASSRTRQVAVAFAAHGKRTLDDLIRGEPRAEPTEIGRLLSAVADALSPLHDQGIAHAYLRPELIAIAGEGVSLEGFGVAQLAQSLGGPTLARDALPVQYRAPELRGAMPARAETWADVYALGVLATELVAGREAPEYLDAPTPRALGVEVGDALEACIAEAVSRSVGNRPRDIELWTLRLEAALGEWGAGSGAAVADARVPEEGATDAEPSTAEAVGPVAEADEGSPGSPAASDGGTDSVEDAAEPSAADAAESPAADKAAEPRVETSPAAGTSAPAAASAQRTKPGEPPPVAPSRQWPAVLAVVGGLLLMVAGVGALFALALEYRVRAASAPVKTATPAFPSVGPLPVMPGPAPPGPAPPGTATAGNDGGTASAPPAPAPLPSGRAVHRTADTDVALPIERDDPVWGKPDAPVTLMVFGDLDCPYTRRSLDVLMRLKARFSDDLRLVWKNRPLDEHPHARDAAEVAVALETESGDAAFWKLAAKVAESSGPSTDARLSSWVSASGSDGGRVKAWLADPRYAASVDRALLLAGRFDVRATPTFFVNGLRIEGYQPFSALEGVVRRELSHARALAASGAMAGDVYADRVRKNLIDLGPTAADRQCPAVAGAPVRGPGDAIVTIVEYSDFQCPFCKRVQPELETLRRHYGSDLRLVWKNFPLAFHQRARPAANFAMEAMARGGSAAFWRVHDGLFAAQPSLDDAGLERVARDAGLDPVPLLDAARHATYASAIDRDVREGQGFGVSGTPSFFINGRPLSGAQPLSKFTSLVDAELAEAKRLVASGTPRKDVYATICGTH